MTRNLKLLGAALLLLALGLGAAGVAIKLFLPEPKLRAWLVEAARKQLGREVRLARVGAGLSGVRLEGLELSERPDFSAGTFAAVESFSLRPSWRALLRKKIVVAAASAKGLRVRVVKGADGRFNYETLAAAPPAGAAAAPSPDSKGAPEEKPELDVRSLELENGRIEYRDEAAGASWDVSELSLSVRGFSLASPFSLETSLRAAGKAGERPIDARLGFKGRIDLARGERAKFLLDADKLTLEQDSLKLEAEGTVKNLEAPALELKAELSAAGKTLLEAKTKSSLVLGPAGVASADGELGLETPGLDTRLLAKLAPSAGVPALDLPAADAFLSGRWEGGAAELKELRLSWSGGKVTGAGKASGLGTPKASYEGRAKLGVDLPELVGEDKPWLKLPAGVRVPAMRLDGELTVKGDELSLSPLRSKTKAGTVEASGVVRRFLSAKPAPDVAVKLELDLPAFRVSELPVKVDALPPSLLVPAAKLDGTVRVKGEDVVFEKLTAAGKGFGVALDGAVAKALAGTPEPAVDLKASLDLPALTDKDLPFAAVPPGLQLPPTKWDADLSYSPRAARVRKLSVKLGETEAAVEGAVSDPGGRGAFDLLIKCRKFVLDELTKLTPATRDMKLGGEGFFALSITGTKEKPVFGGKLQFKNLAATVAELPLSEFTGTASFDERRIDIPNLRGKLADGSLHMDLTVKEYSGNPEIQLEAELDRFDMGKYLAAQKKVTDDRAAAQAAKAAKKGEPAPDAAPAKPIRTRGKFSVANLIHPNADAEKVEASWDVWNLTPDLKKLSGEAKLGAGEGVIRDLPGIMAKSKLAKALFFPVKVAYGVKRVNLDKIELRGFASDYDFKDGLVTLRLFEVDTNAERVSTTGTINLANEALDLLVRIGTGIEARVLGTMSNPDPKVNYLKLAAEAGKALGKPVEKIIGEPAKKLLEGIFKKR